MPCLGYPRLPTDISILPTRTHMQVYFYKKWRLMRHLSTVPYLIAIYSAQSYPPYAI